MKKSKRKLVVAALVFFSISLLAVSPAQAKAKKLKVNTVYTTAKKVKGTTKLKKAKVIAKIDKKTYKVKSNSKGKFTIKIKRKRAKGTKIKVTVYKKKKAYAKKTVRVKTKPWYMKKPFKGHKAALAGNQGISYQKVFNQYESYFLVYCKKGYYVKFTIAGELYGVYTKTYNVTAFANVSTKKPVGTKPVTLRIYRNSDDKLVDTYSITPKKVKLPSKTAAIDYKKLLDDYNNVLKTGKAIDKGIPGTDYCYSIRKDSDGQIRCRIGYMSNLISDNIIRNNTIKTEKIKKGWYRDHIKQQIGFKASVQKGIQVYYTFNEQFDFTIYEDGTETKKTEWSKGTARFDFAYPTLTTYDGILKSGESLIFDSENYSEYEAHLTATGSIYTTFKPAVKMIAIKNEKVVAISDWGDGCWFNPGITIAIRDDGSNLY